MISKKPQLTFALALFVSIFFGTTSFGQDFISGPTNVNQGDTVTYLLTDPNFKPSSTTQWTSSGGSIQGANSQNFVTVLWGNSISPGFVSVTYVDINGYLQLEDLEVTVSITSTPAPTLSSVTQPTCNSATGSFTITNFYFTSIYTVTPSAGVTITGAIVTAPEGSYTLTATSNGITSPVSETIIVDPQPQTIPPVPPTVGTITHPTSQASTGSVQLIGLPMGNWIINPGNHTGSGSSTTITGLMPNVTYNFTVTDTAGCTSDATADVTVISCGLSNENYMHTITARAAAMYLSALTNDQKIEAIQYFDGLGRPMQNIGIRAGGNKEHIVTHIAYDNYGRQDKEWLPYAKTSACGGEYQSDAESATLSYYDNATRYNDDFIGMDITSINPYSQKHFEDSHLSRVLEQGAPGADWAMSNERTVKLLYDFNSPTDDVKYFKVNFPAGDLENPQLTDNGTYNSNELYKTIAKDENWQIGQIHDKDHTREEYKNKQDQVVLKRSYNENQAHDTYYVYDDYGNLTYILPPEASDKNITPNVLNNFAYQYKYDYRNRLVEKKLPGKEREYIVYNKLNQPVLTQDANQRVNNQWLFTKYDNFGRSVYTGIHTFTSSNTGSDLRREVQALANAHNTLWETRQTTTISGHTIDYTKEAYPSNDITVYTVNYYDDYDFDVPSELDYTDSFGQSLITNTTNLATGSLLRILGTNDWITSVIYYDNKSRPIFEGSKNTYLNTVDIVKTELDFVGNSITVRSRHQKGSQPEIVTVDVFTYDHSNRLKTQYQCIGDDSLSNNCKDSELPETIEQPGPPLTETKHLVASKSIILKDGFHVTASSSITFSASISSTDPNSELIVNNHYNELGELQTKDVGNSISKPMQEINYAYNVRGWLKGINNTHGNSSSIAISSEDLFALNINYNSPATGQSLYNGDISEILWKTQNIDNSTKSYNYQYDALDRIVSGLDNTGNYILNSVSYDKSGNILNLSRKGHTDDNDPTVFTTIDNLSYYYNGNQLHSVTDASGYITGFKDSNTSDAIYDNGNDDYSYDVNGNLISDANRGITSIDYNHLNLPKKITFADNRLISYVYDATGSKLEKNVIPQVGTNTITTYAGNYVYLTQVSPSNPTPDAVLQFFNQPEGYVEPNFDGGFDYIYQYKDHLGNVRLSYKDSDNDGSITSSEILEEYNYYPFGLKHKGYNNAPVSSSIALKKQYNGKEHQDEFDLNWYDYGARNYDAATGRWFNVDNMAEEFSSLSPYNYGLNNPISVIDPDGNYAQNIRGQIANLYQQRANTWRYIDSYRQGYGASHNGFGSEAERQAAINNPGNYRAQMNAYSGSANGIWNRTLNQVSTQSTQDFNVGITKQDGMQMLNMVTGSQDWTDGTMALINGNYGDAAYHYAWGSSGLLLRGGLGALSIGKFSRKAPIKSFSELMSPEDAKRYNEFFSGYAPRAYTPRTRMDFTRISSRTNRTESSRVIYDDVGRQIYRVDFTDHMRPLNHSNPHLHFYDYPKGYDPFKGREFRYNFFE